MELTEKLMKTLHFDSTFNRTIFTGIRCNFLQVLMLFIKIPFILPGLHQFWDDLWWGGGVGFRYIYLNPSSFFLYTQKLKAGWRVNIHQNFHTFLLRVIVACLIHNPREYIPHYTSFLRRRYFNNSWNIDEIWQF